MFSIYVLFLILSGIAMLALASVKTGQTTTRRAWNAVFGAGFTVYGLYLMLFHSGHYLVFFYVFILPILMIVRFFRDRPASRGPRPGYGQPSSNGQPSGYGQPSGGSFRIPLGSYYGSLRHPRGDSTLTTAAVPALTGHLAGPSNAPLAGLAEFMPGGRCLVGLMQSLRHWFVAPAALLV